MKLYRIVGRNTVGKYKMSKQLTLIRELAVDKILRRIECITI